MKYEFPDIRYLDDVLPYVENHPDFVVADRGSYIVINYNSMSSDTFRPIIEGSDDAHGNMIRRECRGIVFDKKTRKIISRRFHKFFNLNEREETLLENIDFDQDHRLMEKVDGSMIAPFITSDGVFHIGTKMGSSTDVAVDAMKYFEKNPELLNYCKDCIEIGYTPIFEYCSWKNRIVIEHQEEHVVLLATRHMITGEYDICPIDPPKMRKAIEFKSGVSNDSILKFLENARYESEKEGYVIRFSDGHMLKIKTEWYLAIHKAKDNILREYKVVEMILEQGLDDLLPFLPEQERKEIMVFNDKVDKFISRKSLELRDMIEKVIVHKIDRKTFATEYAESLGPFSTVIFRNWDNLLDLNDTKEKVKEVMSRSLSSNSKWNDFKLKTQAGFQWR